MWRRLKLGLLGGLLLLSACASLQAQGDRAGESTVLAQATPGGSLPAETARQVRVMTAERGTLRANRSTSATVEPQQQARVASSANGRVVSIVKREGNLVEADEVVLYLDDTNAQIQVRNAELALESARINLRSAERATQESSGQLDAQLRTARTNFELARRRYEEGQALYDAGGIARTELTTLEAQMTQAESVFLQAQDAVARMNRAGGEDLALLRVQVQQAENQLTQARQALADAAVRAPFAGEIADLMVEEGEFVGAGSPVFQLVSVERQQARFRVPPEDSAGLQNQGMLYLRYGGLDYASHVVRANPVPGQQRLVEIVAEIYPSRNPIPAGAVAQLRYEVELASGILLPSGAITAEAGQSYTFIVDEGRAHLHPINVLAEAGGQAVVEGLPEGAAVIYPRPLDVRHGTRVQVIEP